MFLLSYDQAPLDDEYMSNMENYVASNEVFDDFSERGLEPRLILADENTPFPTSASWLEEAQMFRSTSEYFKCNKIMEKPFHPSDYFLNDLEHEIAEDVRLTYGDESKSNVDIEYDEAYLSQDSSNSSSVSSPILASAELSNSTTFSGKFIDNNSIFMPTNLSAIRNIDVVKTKCQFFVTIYTKKLHTISENDFTQESNDDELFQELENTRLNPDFGQINRINIHLVKSITEMKNDPMFEKSTFAIEAIRKPRIDPFKKSKLYYSRLNLEELSIVLGLQDYCVEMTTIIQKTVMDIFEQWCGYDLGNTSWVRDTPQRERSRLINKLMRYTRLCYPELNREDIKAIVKRGTYSSMQCQLRKNRKENILKKKFLELEAKRYRSNLKSKNSKESAGKPTDNNKEDTMKLEKIRLISYQAVTIENAKGMKSKNIDKAVTMVAK